MEKIFAACILWIGTDCLPDFNYFFHFKCVHQWEFLLFLYDSSACGFLLCAINAVIENLAQTDVCGFFMLASSLVSAIFAGNPTYFLKPMFSVLVVTYLLYMYKYRYATFRWVYVLMAFSCLFGCVQIVGCV